MPIVDGTRLIGIVSRRDMLRTMFRDDASIAANASHQKLALPASCSAWPLLR